MAGEPVWSSAGSLMPIATGFWTGASCGISRSFVSTSLWTSIRPIVWMSLTRIAPMGLWRNAGSGKVGQMVKLKDVYPLYLNNEAQQPNADLEVTDKYTGEVAFRVAQADAATIDAGIQGAVEAAEPMAKLPSYAR